MKKYNCYYLSSPNGTPKLLASNKTLNEAASICDKSEYVRGEYEHACIEAIKTREYYNIGYSSAQVYVEEVTA